MDRISLYLVKIKNEEKKSHANGWKLTQPSSLINNSLLTKVSKRLNPNHRLYHTWHIVRVVNNEQLLSKTYEIIPFGNCHYLKVIPKEAAILFNMLCLSVFRKLNLLPSFSFLFWLYSHDDSISVILKTRFKNIDKI